MTAATFEHLLTDSEYQLVTREINPRHKQWADAWISSGCNSLIANQAVGYRSNHKVMMHNLTNHPITGRYIRHRLAETRKTHDIRLESLIRYLLRVVDANLLDYDLDDPLDYERARKEIGDLVHKLDIDEGVKIELVSKKWAIDTFLTLAGAKQQNAAAAVNVNTQVNVGVDWKRMAEPVEDGEVIDPDEDQVVEGEVDED